LGVKRQQKSPRELPEALKPLELAIGLEPTTCSLRIFSSMKSTYKMEIYTVFSALYARFLMILYILELLSKYEKIKWAGK